MANSSKIYSFFSSSIIETFIDSIASANSLSDDSVKNSLYLAIGGATVASPTNMSDVQMSRSDDLNDIIFMKRLLSTDMYYSAKTVRWVSGTTYGEWKSNEDLYTNLAGTDTKKHHYVVNSANSVFILVAAARSSADYSTVVASTVEPSKTNTTSSVPQIGFTNLYKTTDGHLWLYVGDTAKTPDNTGLFKVPTSNANALYKGSIFNLTITSQGSGQDSGTITVYGDGTGATFSGIFSGGKLVSVACTNPGSGYTYAKVVVTAAGTNTVLATLDPIITPIWGLGGRMEKDLAANTVTIDTSVSRSDIIIGGNSVFTNGDIFYSKILLVYNPTDTQSPAKVMTDAYIDGTQTLTLSAALSSSVGSSISSGSTSSVDNITSYGKIAYKNSDTSIKVIQPKDLTLTKNNTKFQINTIVSGSAQSITNVASGTWSKQGIVLFANYSDTLQSISTTNSNIVFSVSF